MRVSGGETPPFRPPIPLNDTVNDAQLLQLMRDCWDEFSTMRPDFANIRRRFVHINKGKYDAALWRENINRTFNVKGFMEWQMGRGFVAFGRTPPPAPPIAA